MAVTRCELMAKSTNLDEASDFKRTYRHSFLVTSNDEDDSPGTILDGAEGASPDNLPQMWTTYSVGGYNDTGVYLLSRKASRLVDEEDTRKFWVVECQWFFPTSSGFSSADPPSSVSPLLDPVRYRIETIRYDRDIQTDVNGDPIENSVKDPFDPPVQRNDVRSVLTAVRNMWPLQSVVDLVLNYTNAINSDVFFGAPAHTAKSEVAMGDLQERFGIPYYPVTIRVEFTILLGGTAAPGPDDTWDIRIANKGWNHLYKDPVTLKTSKIPAQEMEPIPPATESETDPDKWKIKGLGKKMSEPVNLIATGGNAGKRKFPDNSDPDYLGPFQLFKAAAFSGLGI